MVRILIILLILSNHALAEENKYSAEYLKKTFNKSVKDRMSAADRLKATNIKTDQLRLLKNSKGLTFKLPNGRWVKGLLLSNNRIAPLFYESGHDYPACVKKDMTLIKGKWNRETELIECDLKQQELAVIDIQESKHEKVLTKEEAIEEEKKAQEIRDFEAWKAAKYAQEETGKNTKESISKYNKNGSVKKVSNGNSDTPKAKPKRKYAYRPPARSTGQVKTRGAVISKKQSNYGISIGTWAKCSLKRSVSSTESGFIEFVLEEDLTGRYKTIPQGSTLFANKRFNAADKRLEANITKALTPEHDEIDVILASVYSLDKTAGLTGVIERDLGAESEQAGTNVLLASLSSMVDSGTGVMGSAINDYSQEMIGNQKKYSNERIKAKIQVYQQPCLIQVSKSF